MRSIEIPQPEDRGFAYRFFEILPGVLTWTILFLPLILSLINSKAAAYFVIFYILVWFCRAVGLSFRSLQGWRQMNHHMKLPWAQMNEDLEALEAQTPGVPHWHERNISRVAERLGPRRVKPSQVYHAVLIAFWNEGREILEPTLDSLVKNNYNKDKVIVMLAYEQRGGPEIKKLANSLVKQYAGQFYHIEAVEHPEDIPGEMIGKGSNHTFCGRRLQLFLAEKKIKAEHTLVTVLDSDTRPHPKYLGALTYTFCSTEEPKYASYQPIPMYTNNIWDAPAPMRVIATGNSFWMVVQSMRQHMLRNFSAHAQPMEALIDTDFWSVRTPVEDGHQYWRTFFRYDGHHEVFPIYVPIYQDAVLTEKYTRTLKAQFIQIRRWAYGASDIAYVAYTGWFKPNHVPRLKLWARFMRLLESHISWSTAPLILAFSALVPWILNRQSFLANQLPQVVGKLQTVAMLGIFVTFFLSMKVLPPRPERYKRHRNIWMVLQWVLLPFTTIIYSAAAAINSQTRLMFGWYLGKFDLTEKAVKK